MYFNAKKKRVFKIAWFIFHQKLIVTSTHKTTLVCPTNYSVYP